MGEFTPSLLALQLVTGIALGAIYALLAVGLSLIFGMLTVVNFAMALSSWWAPSSASTSSP